MGSLNSTVIRANGNEWQIVTDDPDLISKLGKRGYAVVLEGNPLGFSHFTLPAGSIRFHKADNLPPAKKAEPAKKAWGFRAAFELNRW